jgi:predicted alpha/beta superfamily hydrolase
MDTMIDATASFILDDIPCCVHTFGTLPHGNSGIPLFVMPVAFAVPDLLEGQHTLLDHVVDEGRAPAFMLAVFETPSWDDCLSPWPAPAIRKGGPDFGGGAQTTLDWILNRLIPAIEKHIPAVCDGARGILGYSMAGMFALWAIYQTDYFTVCASCSGSLWYEGFADYIDQNPIKAHCSVYMNLGIQEEKTRHRIFRQVGDATRHIAKTIESSPMAKQAAFKWFPGGHSGFTGRRIAAAQLWMARHI